MTTVAVREDMMAANTGTYVYGLRCREGNIEEVAGELIGVSGNTADIAKLVQWYLKGEFDTPPEYTIFKNDDNPAATLLVLTKTGVIKLVCPHGLITVLNVPFFAIGSGAMAAMGAMQTGVSAGDAVVIAAMIDPDTTGPVEVRRL